MLSRTDEVMKNIWLRLSEDANASTEGAVALNPQRKYALKGNDIKTFREWHYNHDFNVVDPYVLKWRIQLDTLFKRYKFEKDSFSEDDLRSLASAKFAADQLRIAGPLQISLGTEVVLKEARRQVRNILGSYEAEEHTNLCKFSSHANRGISYVDSYFDVKACRLTGSVEHIQWFKQLLSTDQLLNHAVHEQGRPKYIVCESLRLAKVPKSWKAVRTMMPHTVCGSFYTYGLGALIRRRLLDAGQDISRLQDRHRILAERFSKTRTHVTADLSAASDSFNRELLCRLLPRRWFKAVMFGNPRYYTDESQTYSLQSPMTMGMGHTFPLQTLLFYCLLRAVQRLTGVGGLISVYGDDLIYPRKMHKIVVAVFRDLNFNINAEKTFVESHFRESCGGDYFRGFDVRPFCPEGQSSHLSRKKLLEWYYTLYNGLRLRWDEVEIPRTLHYLLTEIVNVECVIHQVPTTYPENSGIKVDVPRRNGIWPWSHVNHVAYSPDSKAPWWGQRSFSYLRQVPADRVVKAEGLHLWHALRDLTVSDRPQTLYDEGRPRLRLVKKRVGRKVLYVTVESDKSVFQTLSQTGHDSWSKRP